MLLVAESGMEVDLESVRRSGCRAFLAATIGVVMPVAFSVTILVPIFGSNIREALAAGSAIAPTSLGFTASLLGDELQTPMGQLIAMAAGRRKP